MGGIVFGDGFIAGASCTKSFDDTIEGSEDDKKRGGNNNVTKIKLVKKRRLVIDELTG